MQSIRTLAAALCASTALFAASGSAQAPQPATATAQQDLSKEYDALLARFDAAQSAFEDEMNALRASYDEQATEEVQRAFMEKWQAAQAKNPAPQFAPEFVALAEKAKGTEVAAKAWLKVLELPMPRTNGDSPAHKAIERLLADHIASPLLEPVVMHLRYGALEGDAGIAGLQRLRTQSPHARIKAAATYALGVMPLEDEQASAEQKAQGREMLLALQRDFAGVKGEHMDESYADMGAHTLFQIEHLQVGMQVPDFEATDQDGKKFKLSDYKGKVVMIDFWGFW